MEQVTKLIETFQQARLQVGEDTAKEFAIDYLKEMPTEDFEYFIKSLKEKEQRSNRENNSIQKGCRQIADVLNGFGLTFKVFVREDIDAEWDVDLVRRQLLIPYLKAKTGKTSTRQFKKGEAGKFWEDFAYVIAKRIQDLTGEMIIVDYPSEETRRINKTGY